MRHISVNQRLWKFLLCNARPARGWCSAAFVSDTPSNGQAQSPASHSQSVILPQSQAWLHHLGRFDLALPSSLQAVFPVRTLTSISEMADNKFMCDYARMGTSGCKKCKQKLPKGGLRLAKVVSNPFTDEGGEMKQYHHASCLFETFIRARATTKIIEEEDDIQGFENLEEDDKESIRKLIKETLEKKGKPKTPKKKGGTPAKATPTKATPTKAAVTATPPAASPAKASTSAAGGSSTSNGGSIKDDAEAEKDNSFRQFRRLCAEIAEETSYTGKTNIVQQYISKGSSGGGFKGDVYLLLKLLLPGVVKTVYNLNSKQLVKIFSTIFRTNLSEMQEDLEQGDVAETVRIFFEKSTGCPPVKKSTLSIQQVDELLTELANYTREDDQQTVLRKMAGLSTANDLKMVVRLIKHDLRINSGAKHILDALDPNAYQAFQASRNLRDVVDRVMEARDGAKPGMSKKLSVRANLMTPILPMLAEACKSVDMAFKKCPNGMYAEIKYDGERVQVHKQGDSFSYFSRSLKPVLNHKVSHFKDYIPQAFQNGNDLILDAEVLLIDTNTGKPLPFGTLGVHKRSAFQEAKVCLFIFDCIHYNGENLLNRPIKERRKFLQQNMTEVPNRILFSEMTHITEPADLKDLIMKVIREGLEGLVLKDVNSTYEPGKRHWLKVKKDYLAQGAMADTADLVVIGAYFGTGNKGGMMSIFLMGVYNPKTDKWCTVTKCGSGFDDATLAKLQKQFDMVKITKDYSKVPSWLSINRNVVPDFVVKDPKKSSVWEITGAEFSKSESHTANGISIRFPRCTKMRDDKSWSEATSLPELEALYKKSKEYSDIPDLLAGPSKGGKFKKKVVEDAMDVDEEASSSRSNSASPARTPVKTPKKRPADESPGATPSKQAKPECKFGASCYQASPDHRKKYHHPSSSKDVTEGDKHLPDVFKGMKLHIPKDIDDYATLRRYVIAFDGDIVADFEESSATHCVVKDQKDVKSDRYVPVSWVWQCIMKKKLVPLKK